MESRKLENSKNIGIYRSRSIEQNSKKKNISYQSKNYKTLVFRDEVEKSTDVIESKLRHFHDHIDIRNS